jgi:hypothetical protein
MAFTWKDAIGTLLVVLAGIVTLVLVTGNELPVIGSSWALGTLMLLILGLAASAFEGYGPITETNGWMTYAVVLGTFGVVAGIAGVFFNSQFWFLVLSADIFLLWLGSILYHALGRAATPRGTDRPITFG